MTLLMCGSRCKLTKTGYLCGMGQHLHWGDRRGDEDCFHNLWEFSGPNRVLMGT